ncbi:MAG: hypothetical protein WD226_13100 [Planctomycetota bacterium]
MSPDAERRSSNRRPLETAVALRVVSTSLSGLSDNLSDVGLLLTLEEPLVVEVELTVDGERVVRTGRLVRLEPLEALIAGVAIEFDT